MPISRLFDNVIRGLGLMAGILIVVNGVFVSYEVVMRYFFRSPTTWVLEITIYLVIASTFLALAYVLLEKAHVRVDSVTNLLS
jgi:TRAP-type C4-dicarboxylate transport system permease small subunit